MRTPFRSLGGLLLTLLAFAGAPARAGYGDWRYLSAGHFQLYSTLSETTTRDIGRELQAFELTVGELLHGEDRLPDVPTVIYVLGHRDFVEHAQLRPGLAGFFAQRAYANVIVIDGSERPELFRVTVFHEYVHYIERSVRPMQLPPWYTEGFAELYSAFNMRGRTIRLGEPPSGVRLYMNQWIPVERILAVKQSDPEYRTERLAPQFYAESWALVHLLLFDDTALTRPTAQYLDNIDAGLPEPRAFSLAFPFDKAGLDKALRQLLERRVIHVKSLTRTQELSIEQAPLSRLTETQARVALARLTFLLGRPHAEVDALIAAAQQKDPADRALRALAARVAAHAQRAVDVADLADALARGGEQEVELRLDVADALVTLAAAPPASALAILDPLVHGAAPPIEAVAIWTRAAEASELAPGQLTAVLEPASRRAPHDTRLLAALARACERAGDTRQARTYYTRIMMVSSAPEERLWAQKQADSERLTAPAAPRR